MGVECSTCQNCQKKDELQNEVQQASHPHMNSYSMQPNEEEDPEQGIEPIYHMMQASQHSGQQIPQKYDTDKSHEVNASDPIRISSQHIKTPGPVVIQQQPEIKNAGVILTNESINKDKESQTKKLSQYQEERDAEFLNPEKQLSDIREKREPFQFKSGALYDGEWKGTMRDGFGTQTWPDGAKYIGDWRQNKANGKGKFWHVDGDYFEGEWKDDKANGFGTYIHTNGAKYEGDWKDDLQDGVGTETWTDGSKYHGQYRFGRKQGYGVYNWNDGSQYVGQWQENRIQGFGQYSWLDGRKYEGFWLNNTMHGRGVYTWKDGRKYDGEYDRDKKHGYGQYIWNDGRVYEGQWANGKQSGKGRYILPDGTKKMGLWDDGRRIRWIEGEENASLKPVNWDNFKMPDLKSFQSRTPLTLN